MKVAVIGLGTMGMGAALNLVRKGHEVTGVISRDDETAPRIDLDVIDGIDLGGVRNNRSLTQGP